MIITKSSNLRPSLYRISTTTDNCSCLSRSNADVLEDTHKKEGKIHYATSVK